MSQRVAAVPEGSARETPELILDAAEVLFAADGFNGVSLRAITTKAHVNLAAVSYHFGSKEGLFRAVLRRRLEPINQERIRLLAACMERSGTNRPDVAEVLDAFLGPAIRVSGSPKAEVFRALSARLMTDPSAQARTALYELYDDGARPFIAALRLACPEIGEEDLYWRLSFIYGAMMYVRADNGRIRSLLGVSADISDPGRAMVHLVPFLQAGMALPSLA